MATTQEEKILLGEAAEHLVLARLLRRMYLASQGPRGLTADDILIKGGLTMQVKANKTGPKGGWFVDQSEPRSSSFYALVDFTYEDEPIVYVLPSDLVQRTIEAEHKANLRRNPSAKDSGIRKIHDPWGRNGPPPGYKDGWLAQYREAWDLLPSS
jgi:hypothetical protein